MLKTLNSVVSAQCKIRCFVMKEKNSVEIFDVYDDRITIHTSVYKWYCELKDSHTLVRDNYNREKPSTVTDELVNKIENSLRDNRKLAVHTFSMIFP